MEFLFKRRILHTCKCRVGSRVCLSGQGILVQTVVLHTQPLQVHQDLNPVQLQAQLQLSNSKRDGLSQKVVFSGCFSIAEKERKGYQPCLHYSVCWAVVPLLIQKQHTRCSCWVWQSTETTFCFCKFPPLSSWRKIK